MVLFLPLKVVARVTSFSKPAASANGLKVDPACPIICVALLN